MSASGIPERQSDTAPFFSAGISLIFLLSAAAQSSPLSLFVSVSKSTVRDGSKRVIRAYGRYLSAASKKHLLLMPFSFLSLRKCRSSEPDDM